MAQTPSMARLVAELTRLPGIGEKTATRLAFHILRSDRSYAEALAQALLAVKDETRLCSVCFALTEVDPCPICADPQRGADTTCCTGRWRPWTVSVPTSSRSSRCWCACATRRFAR